MSNLGRLLGATISVPDLAGAVAAYERSLGFVLRGEGVIPDALAHAYAAPAAAGSRYAIVGAASDTDVVLRLVGGPQPPSFAPLRVSGWSSLVLPVQAVDELAKSLVDTAFAALDRVRETTIAGVNGRVLHVRGPGNEVLSFIETKPGGPLPTPRARIDSVFAASIACPELDRATEFYENKLLLDVAPVTPMTLWAVNDAFGFDGPTRHEVRLISLPGSTMIELQQFPESVVRRPAVPRHLPPGIALVSFAATSTLDDVPVYSLTGQQRIDEAPYGGRTQMTFYGAANEMIELIEGA